MTRKALKTATETRKMEIRMVLQTVYDALNPGQQKQIIKDKTVKALLDLYGVAYHE